MALSTIQHSRQIQNIAALSTSIGTAANTTLDSILSTIDSKMVNLASAQTLTNKTLAFLQTSVVTDSTTTGASATLQSADIAAGVVRLTNTSLTSISGIPAGAAGQQITLENQTGVSVNILNNDSGATAANRIYTGTGTTVAFASNSTFTFVYDTTSSRWMLSGGTGGGGFTDPQTTKGDMITYSTLATRHAVPGDYGRLIPDSIQTDGWRSASYTQIQQGRPGKNYIQYADFENNSTTGWSLGTIGTLTNGLPTGTPTFGSGASGNLSISTVSSGQLAGNYSLSYVSSAATTQGNMLASQAYTIDAEDQAKVLTVKFYYSVASGASNCNFSGSNSNSFAWAAYDVTNSSWLSSAGNFNLVQNSGAGYVTGTVQTNANTSQIRFVFYNANATSGAATLYLDDFYVGPQTAPSGPAMSDWVSYIPTISSGFGTTSNVSFYYKRIGDSLSVIGNFTAGTTTSTLASVSLPSGLSIDSTKLPISNTTSNPGPAVGRLAANVQTQFAVAVTATGTSTSLVYFGSQEDSGTTLVPASPSNIINSNSYISLYFTVPISGWSSNTSLSIDTDTRVISCRVGGAVSSTSSANPIVFPTVYQDTSGSYSGGTYTIPVSGEYRLSAILLAGTSNIEVNVYQNGTILSSGGAIGYTTASGNFNVATGSLTIKCNAGDTITIRPNGTLSSISQDSSWSIERLSGPAVVAATESISMKYYGATTGTSSSLNNVVFPTKAWDSHNGFNTTTGTYTVPVTGKYAIVCGLQSASNRGASSVNSSWYYSIFQNGVQGPTPGYFTWQTTSNVYPTIPASTTLLQCNAGDTIQIQQASNNGTAFNLSGDVNSCLEIFRIGN